MLVLALAMQFVAIAALLLRLRERTLSHIGAVFIIMAIMYHGVGEIFVRLFPEDDAWRPLVATTYVDKFIIWISLAILLTTIGYLCALGRDVRQPSPRILDDALRRTTRIFDWKILLLVAIPMLALTLHGQGFFSNGSAEGVSVVSGLTSQFFVLALVLATVGIVQRFGRQYLLVALGSLCLVTALVGERLVILWGAGMALYAFGRFGIRLGRRAVAITVVVLLVVGLAITAARTEEGRFNTATSGSVRVSDFLHGLTGVMSVSTLHAAGVTLGSRLDGNSFGAMELAALDTGQHPLGVAPLEHDVALAVPTFIAPGKDQMDPSYRVEKLWAEEHLGLVQLETAPGAWMDILPTQLGSTLGDFGPLGMLAVALVIGLLFGRLDRWLLGGIGPARILIGLGFLYCVLDYEDSWDTYTVALRGIALLLVLVLAVQGARAAVERRRVRALVN